MTSLLAISQIALYVIIGLVAVIVFGVIMHLLNRHFRIKYDLNLFWGGLLMLIAIGLVVLGIFVFEGIIRYAAIAGALLLVIVTLIYDCKRCGGVGVGILFCQILFSVGSLFIIFEFIGNKGSTRSSRREDRYIRRERERRGYTNNYGRSDRNDRYDRY